MKRIFLALSISLITFSATYAQENNAELLNQRNQYFQDYKNFKDTMTIRTWFNMVELSKRLESVVVIDNILLDSLLVGTPNNANLEARVRELTGIRDQLITDNARLNAANDSYQKQKNNFLFSIIVISIILVILAFSWFKYMARCKKLEKSSGKNNDKVLLLKQSHKEENDALKDKIKKLKEDQLLMENTASQMKKSYEILKSDGIPQKKSDGLQDNEDIAEVRKEMDEFSAEISNILEEKQKIEKELELANEELLKFQNANKTMEDELIKYQSENQSIENELELLLKKFKKE